jgi:predicted O-methyltransferase YrrM
MQSAEPASAADARNRAPRAPRAPLLPRLLQTLRRRLPRRVPPMVRRVQAEALTYLDRLALCELHAAVARAEQDRRPGALIEVGCALGGSALVMAAARAPGRPFRVYDVFGMPPGPSEGDGPDVHARWAEIAGGRSEGIGGRTYYGYVDNLLERVAETFRAHGFHPGHDGIELVPGLVQDTLGDTGPVAVAHVDCDRYASVMTCLERIAPRLVPGGVMIVDDYDSKSGCRRAVDEYFRGRGAEYRLVRRTGLHVTRR